MPPVFVKDGRERCMELVQAGTWTAGLFKNNFTPDADTEQGELTEADFSGYAAAPFTWGAITLDGSGRAQMFGDVLDFVHDGGGTSNSVYGWFISHHDGSSSVLYACERFSDAPRPMSGLGDTIQVTPKHTETQE